MPAPTFLVFELGIYILAICCLRHAWSGGRARVVGLLAGVLYGLLLHTGPWWARLAAWRLR